MIPKILYHGTTRGRYEVGIKQTGLDSQVPALLKVDQEHQGYVYLCEDLDDAAFYALLTFAFDDQIPKFKQLNEVMRNAIILTVRTSTLRDNIEVDPEYDECKEAYTKEGVWDLAHHIQMRGLWYRHNGSIPTKLILPYKDVPFDIQHEETKHMMMLTAQSKMSEEKFIELFNQAQKVSLRK